MKKILKCRLLMFLCKMDKRELFLFGAATAILGLVVEICLVTFSLFTWPHSPPAKILSISCLQLSLGREKHWPSVAVPLELDTPLQIQRLKEMRLNSSMAILYEVQASSSPLNFSLQTPKVHDRFADGNATVFTRKRRSSSNGRKRRRRKRGEQDELSEVDEIAPTPQTPPTPLQKHIWSLSPKEALVYAKRELQIAPIVANDSQLYAPIFKNVSMSYELMELTLKVYVYPDGEPPIFHEPQLSGIYASEGWFMKLMESNQQFITRDPEKAHLFYLPYSTRQLQRALHVEGSHKLAPLSHFLRDYVDSLATKYPFWNRTRGADHFLVACHDWGPYTLNAHKELAKNAIKALCNADISEGVFKGGKDVSLPETTIRVPRNPHRNVGGGKRVSQRPILAFFAGNLHGRVRPVLLRHWHNKEESMHIYGPFPHSVASKMTYIEHMKSSKFCICPMGYEVNSPRIVEAIYYECIPVIIADNFVPPFDDVLDWTAFSVIVPEDDIPKLKEILMAIPLRRYLKMLANLKMLQRHFLWNLRPIKYDLFHMILHSIWLSRLNQFQIPG